jgi:hypothetical protein
MARKVGVPPERIVRLNTGDVWMIRFVVDRCHVADSHERVWDYLASRMKPGYFDKLAPHVQARMRRVARAAHEHNRCQYQWIDQGLHVEWREYKRAWMRAKLAA